MLFFWWNTASWSCHTFIEQLQIIKNLLIKARWLRSVPKAVKKNKAEAPYFTNWKVLWKRSSLRIIRRVLKEELQSNQVKIPFMNWWFEKWTRFLASVTCSRYQIAFKWSVNFWLQLFSLRWDGKYFNGWNFYLGILQIQENWAGKNLITNSRVYPLLISQAKMQTEINNN